MGSVAQSNVVFIVQGVRLQANRNVMMTSSDYFRALLCGGFAESNQSEIVLGALLKPFRAVLDYIQNKTLPTFELESEFELVNLANQYNMKNLLNDLSIRLCNHLDYSNICSMLRASQFYNLDILSKFILNFVDENVTELIKHDSFKQLPMDFLVEILKRDSLSVFELDIFKALVEWRAENPNENFQALISHVRFVLMDLIELLDVVCPLGILSSEQVLNIIRYKHTSTNLPYRHLIVKDVNIATSEYRARCIHGEFPHFLLDGIERHFGPRDGDGWTCHTIYSDNLPENGIIVELGGVYYINHIRMLLWEGDRRKYSYYIAVSLDQEHWERVVDYSAFQNNRESWQNLDFKPCLARFISVVGTRNTLNKWFHLVHFEAQYKSERVVQNENPQTRPLR